METYIQLNRSFRLPPKDHEFNEEAFEIAQSLGLGDKVDTHGWDQLLDLYRVIILAEAGAGKTEEIRQIAIKLRSEGKDAFFFRLESLSGGLRTSFEIGNEQEFDVWLSSKEEAWFFLDSVDEARLKSFRNFEEAIRSFAAELGANKQRVRDAL